MIVNDIIINADCGTVLEELRRQLAINQIPYLQRIRDSGNDYMVQCPFHGNGQERKPSMGIRKSDGIGHCFACNSTHTLPEIVSYCFGKDDMFGKWGMQWLVKNFATVSIEERKDVEIDMERNNISNKSNVLDDNNSDKSNYVSEEELDSYRYYHEYWTKRGIINDNIIELFDLGYDKKTDCITFPVRDIEGNCLFVARRNVKTKWFNYPKDVEKPLYGLYELHHAVGSDINPARALYEFSQGSARDIFICESMIDCILLWQVGEFAVALNGTGSELQFKQLRNLPCRHLILATDNDEAGQRAREKIRKNVPNKLITEIQFPDNRKDIGECTKEELEHIDMWEVF